MIKSYYFAVRDGSYDPETGETYEAGMVAEFYEQEMPKGVTTQNINGLRGTAFPVLCRAAPSDHRGGIHAGLRMG